ncbi:MAG: tetratricopeptide repeat protein [Acidobacteriia bacterium]|nr:tetratricopeptide repeat protein [Terriglobia bacterium]
MRNRTLRLLGALSFALASCRSAKVHVSDAEAELTVASAAREKGDFRAALEHAQKAVVLAPRMIQAHFTVGEIADVMCLPNAQPGPDDRTCGLAIEEYKTTLQLNPSHGEALKDFAFLLFQFGKSDESESYYRKALALHPDDPGLLGAVAGMDFRRIAPDVVETKVRLGLGAKKALIQSPACADVRDRNQARFEESIALLLRALEISKNNPEFQTYLGALYSLRAEIQCGDRANYQADMNSSRVWDMAAKDSAAKFGQNFFQKVPAAPPPPPDIQ